MVINTDRKCINILQQKRFKLLAINVSPADSAYGTVIAGSILKLKLNITL